MHTVGVVPEDFKLVIVTTLFLEDVKIPQIIAQLV